MLFISLMGYSQFNENAPWMKDVQAAKKGSPTIDEIKTAFDNYWAKPGNNKDAKGSGYKPFMRWEYHVRNTVKENGEFVSSQEMLDILKNKKLASQNSSLRAMAVNNWEPIGPLYNATPNTRALGRVNIIVVDPNNSNTIYFGTPAGGIWKSLDSGGTWSAMFDEYPQIGVSGIAIDYTNSNTIYIATGDKNAGDSSFVGVYKSTDGGNTWNTTGAINGVTRAGDLIMHPTNSQILFCATSAGIFRTTNGGTTWTNVRTGSFHQGSIRVKPGTASTVYATSTNSFFRSTDDGSIFASIGTGLPFSSNRLLLDVTPASNNFVYVLSANTSDGFQGVYKSTDGGDNFTRTAQTTDVFEGTQAWYDLAFAVSDTNANEIYTGCLNIWKSTNGGDAFTRVNQWNVADAAFTHADIHHLQFIGNKLYCGSDGGTYVSNNSAASFAYITNGAQISQFYKVSVSKQTSANVSGGLQDNGGYALSGGTWKGYHGGDGMDSAIDPSNQNKYYGFSQYGGSLNISSNGGVSLSGQVGPPTTTAGANIQGNWVTPLMVNSIGEAFSGFSGFYKLVSGAWVKQNVGPSLGSGNYELISVDPNNDDIVYVVNGNRIYKSINRGINFTTFYTASTNITSLDVHSTNSNTIYITTAGASGLAMRTTTGTGAGFISISAGLPSIGKNIIVHQARHTDNPLYIGTELGVYYKDDTMASWVPFDTNLPNTSITDLEINVEDSKLIAGTYGRGVWQTDIPVQVPPNDVKFVSLQSPSALISCGGSISPMVQVKNNGSNTLTTIAVNYTIDATPYVYNWNGSLVAGATTTITLPNITTARGAHKLTVVTTTSGDAYADNNEGSVPFYTNDAGTVGVVNPFTNTTDALLTYDDGEATSQWVRGIRSDASAMDSAGERVYTTNLLGNYPDTKKSYLVSQCYNLTNVSNPNIEFKMKFDLEINWDIVYVEYSTNFGANWAVLGTMGANWYNSDRTSATAGNDCYNCPGAQWTGTNTTNTTYTYPLASLGAPSNVIFRIVFHSDEAVNNLGVNIDDFVITGTLANESFELNNIAIYPNPSKGLFSISLGNISPTLIEVYDVTGKLILAKKDISITNFVTSVDLSAASQGIYFIKIATDEQQIVKRIIKE
jgi:hypothetical protein